MRDVVHKVLGVGTRKREIFSDTLFTRKRFLCSVRSIVIDGFDSFHDNQARRVAVSWARCTGHPPVHDCNAGKKVRAFEMGGGNGSRYANVMMILPVYFIDVLPPNLVDSKSFALIVIDDKR